MKVTKRFVSGDLYNRANLAGEHCQHVLRRNCGRKMARRQRTPCAVAYKITGQWSGKFAAQIALTNLTAPTNGWTLSWVFPGGQTIRQLANGEYAQNEAVVTVNNGAWNRTLRTGQTTIIAFQADAGSAHPTQFALNGAQCAFEAVNAAPIFWRP
ncbi:MAG: cellulose binding domain-containing protein [Caldilineaceae bacterium]